MRTKAIGMALALGLLALWAMPAGATGLLIPTDGGVGPLAIKYHRATVKITDRVAVTKVEQVFINHTDRDLEATYIFPLPKGATVSDFYLYVNGKRTKGEILEKNRARNIYEGIVRRMQDPGLVEYLGRDLFQCRVYPVPRRGEQKLEIEFTSMLSYEGGVVAYSYPMRTDRGSARTMQDFTMSVALESKVPIKSIYSPTHEIYSRKQDDHHAAAGFEKSAALLDRDFELFYTVSEKDVGLNLLAFREPGEPGFFLLMASPKSEYTDREIIGKRISFVIDTSGSMAGEKMQRAKAALKYALNKLNGDDLFNVVRFSTDVEAFDKTPVSASKENVQRALNFVERMEPAGGTAIDEALSLALAGHVKDSEPNLVVFITDGHPTVGETDPERILKNTAVANKVQARIFVFGVGDEINTHLLDRLAGENFGDSTYVKPGQEMEQTLSTFYDKVSHPVLADLKLDFGKIHEYDVLPKRLPDLFKGSQVLVFGRYRNDGHSALTLTGLVGKDRKSFVFEGAFPKESRENDFIPRLWATRKIGFLLDQIRLGGERQELVDEVIGLSKRYGIVTPYTSYLVTEDTPQLAVPADRRRPQEERRPLWQPPKPSSMPRGGGMDGTLAGESEDSGPMMAPASAAPARREQRAKASKRFEAYGRTKGDGMKEASGAEAVDMAQAVRDMKDADKSSSVDDQVSGIRYVSGRAFQFRDGGWMDSGFKPSMKVLKVKYMGKAYFELLTRSPLLKKFFALGQRLVVVVGPDRALVVAPDGADEISAAELTKFVP